jgi:hypothetical protein
MPRVVAAQMAALVRNQAAAIAGSYLALLIVEALVTGLTTGLAKWLPAEATIGLLRTGTWFGLGKLAPVCFGALLLTTYTVVVAWTGVRISMQRESVS